VRSLGGLEGWAAEGDASGAWLVEPISPWYELPAAIQPGGTKPYDLRELRISPDTALVSGVEEAYYPLATPMPTPESAETPWPDDPRAGNYAGFENYAEHSVYTFSGTREGFMSVFDLRNPLSREYLVDPYQVDCIQLLQKALVSDSIQTGDLRPFCGMNGAFPLHFTADIQAIQFTGGKGIRYLISSSNYLTVNQMVYIFQGLSEDGRYYITLHYQGISHPYIVGHEIFEMNLGPLIAWRSGQYEEAAQSYQVFNERIETLLEAGVVPLYPSLELLDAMVASIEIK
jgi:hypothetical protein